MRMYVRQRQMIFFQNRYWDRILVGMLQTDWKTNFSEE
jgi:hypothetical protein